MLPRRLFLLATALLAVSCGTYTARVEAFARLQTLNAELLASPSATQTLERWCAERRIADDPKIVAVRIEGVEKAPTAEQLQRLGVESASEIRYRRVELRCGAHVLSVADNWYVPGRLTSEMNRSLETTDTPFGKVVRPLQPYRRTIHMASLWSPLRNRSLDIPRDLLEHRALLYTSGHQPFAEVVETYRRGVLEFRQP